MRIFLTGGTGFVGSALVPWLLNEGHELVLSTRSPTQAKQKLELQPDSRLEFVKWNGTESDFPKAALSDCHGVIHLMGENIGEGRWTQARKESLFASRVSTTRAIVSALAGTQVRHFLSASAVGIYPHSLEKRYEESDFLSEEDMHKSFLVSLASAWEREAAQAESSEIRCVRMRIGVVLGHGGFVKTLAPLYRMGLGGPLGSGNQYVSWIHLRDLVRAILFTLNAIELRGPVNMVSPGACRLSELSAAFAAAVRRPHLFRVPEFAARLALGQKAEMVLSSQLVYPAKLLQAGFTFDFPDAASALRDVLRS